METKSSPAKTKIAVILLSLLILVLRRSESVLHPVFFCEDSTVFYLGAREIGIPAFFQTYSGYYHLVPRTVAFFGNWLPAAWVPVYYLVAAMAAVSAAMWKIGSARWEFRYTPAMVLAIALVPHTCEVYLCLVNVQWTLSLVLVVLALQNPPTTRREAVSDFIWLVTAGFTGPYVLFFWPLFLWRFLVRGRTAYDARLLAVSTVLAAIQCYAVIQEHEPYPEFIDTYGLLGIASERLINELFGISYIGITAKNWVPCLIIAAGFVVVTGWVVIAGRKGWSAQQRQHVWGLLGAIGLLAGIVHYKFAAATFFLVDKLEPNGDRYFFIPHVLMLWFLIACWELEGTAGKWTRILCVWAVVAAIPITVFRTPLFEDAWQSRAAEVDEGKFVRLQVNPGWILEVNKPKDPDETAKPK